MQTRIADQILERKDKGYLRVLKVFQIWKRIEIQLVKTRVLENNK